MTLTEEIRKYVETGDYVGLLQRLEEEGVSLCTGEVPSGTPSQHQTESARVEPAENDHQDIDPDPYGYWQLGAMVEAREPGVLLALYDAVTRALCREENVPPVVVLTLLDAMGRPVYKKANHIEELELLRYIETLRAFKDVPSLNQGQQKNQTGDLKRGSFRWAVVEAQRLLQNRDPQSLTSAEKKLLARSDQKNAIHYMEAVLDSHKKRTTRSS